MLPPSLQPLVYKRLFPRPQPTDPEDFTQFVAKCIVPEVRQETMRFYGPQDSLESSYPGLDYASKAHRTRLRLYTWHRRLFRVFDELGLSPSEIHAMCKWEGTKYSKEKYERENNTFIRNTTWDGVRDYRPTLKVESVPAPEYDPAVNGRLRGGAKGDAFMEFMDREYASGETSETDDEIFTSSIGTSLQQHLIEATAARARGEDVMLDPAWEQWMKDVTERGLTGQDSLYGPSSIAGPSNLHRPRGYDLVPNPYINTRTQPASSYRPSAPETYQYTFGSMPPTSRLPQPSSSQRRMGPPLLPRIRVQRTGNHRSSASPAR